MKKVYNCLLFSSLLVFILSSCSNKNNYEDPLIDFLNKPIQSAKYDGFNTITVLDSNDVIEYHCLTEIGINKAYYVQYDDNFTNFEYYYSQDSEGYVKEDYLDINNKISYKDVYDYNNNKVLYEESFLVSPFINLINKVSDFKKIDNYSYEYIGEYKNDLTYHLTYEDLDVNKITFTFNKENNLLDTIQITSNVYEINSTKVSSEYFFKVSDINLNKVKEVEVKKNTYQELDDIFNNIKEFNNYTLSVTDSMYDGEVIYNSLYKYNKDQYYSEIIDLDDDNNEITIKSLYKYNDDKSLSYYDIDKDNNIKEVKRYYQGIIYDVAKFNFNSSILDYKNNRYYVPYGIGNDFVKELITDYKGLNGIEGTIYLLINDESNLELHLEYSLLGLVNGELTYVFSNLNNTNINIDLSKASKYQTITSFNDYNSSYKDEFNKVEVDINDLVYVDGINYDYNLNRKTGVIQIYSDLINKFDTSLNLFNDYNNLLINKGYVVTYFDNKNNYKTFKSSDNKYKINLYILTDEISNKYSLIYEIKNNNYTFSDYNSFKDYSEEIDKELTKLLGNNYNLPFFKGAKEISIDPSSITNTSLMMYVIFYDDVTSKEDINKLINEYIIELIKNKFTKVDEFTYSYSNYEIKFNIVEYYGYYLEISINLI